MHYRRAQIKGGTYFFTLNLAERKKTLLIAPLLIVYENT